MALIEEEERALEDILNGHPLATNKYAVLAAVDDDEQGWSDATMSTSNKSEDSYDDDESWEEQDNDYSSDEPEESDEDEEMEEPSRNAAPPQPEAVISHDEEEEEHRPDSDTEDEAAVGAGEEALPARAPRLSEAVFFGAGADVDDEAAA